MALQSPKAATRKHPRRLHDRIRKNVYFLGAKREVAARRKAVLEDIASYFGGVDEMLQKIADGKLDVVYLEIEEDSDEYVIESIRQAFEDIAAGRVMNYEQFMEALKRDE